MPALPAIRLAHRASVVAVALSAETRGVPPSTPGTPLFSRCLVFNIRGGRTAIDPSPPLPTLDVHPNA